LDKSITAILIKAEEWRDYDYRVTLFSAEGMVKAVMRGVRKKDAKLKFAAQPFALCSYEISTRNNNVVTGASMIESLSQIANDIDKFKVGCLVLECVEQASSAVESSELFLTLLKSLKALLYSAVNPRLIGIKFLQKVLFDTGFCRFDMENRDVATVSGLLGAVASSTLTELDRIEASEEDINAALIRTATLFEQNLDCELKTKRGFTR